MMTKQEFKEWDAILRKQREDGLRSKAAAKKMLTEMGIMHLLIPKDQKSAGKKEV